MKSSIKPTASDIAVIGMGCYFPEADTPEKFWENLKQGKDLIRDIPPERMTDHCFDQVKSRRGSFLEEPYHFDADLFRITPEVGSGFGHRCRTGCQHNKTGVQGY